MLLNDLGSTLRVAGLTVTEAAGWVGHNHGAMSSVECVVIHHTAGAATGDYPSYNVVRNGRSDLAGPLAQLGCGRSGRMYVFSNGVSWHAGATLQTWQDNQHAIGIEVESTGTGVEWPLVQVHAAAKAAAALCRKYGVSSSRVLGHKEICSPPGRKVDPVGIPGDMRGFRSLVQYYITNPEDEVELTDPFNETAQKSGTVGHALLNMKQNLVAVRGYVDTLESGVAAARSDASAAKAAAQAASIKGDVAIGKVDAVINKVDALIAQVATLQGGGGVVDLAAVAKAVNDDAARRQAE